MIIILAMLLTFAAGALGAYESRLIERRRERDPFRTGMESDYSGLGERDWWDMVVTSAEIARK